MIIHFKYKKPGKFSLLALPRADAQLVVFFRTTAENAFRCRSVSIVVGPVIGEVTDTTARILIEVDAAASVTCTLTSKDLSTKLTATTTFAAGIPAVFKFSGLPQATFFNISFDAAQIKNAEDRQGSFKTLPSSATTLNVVSFSCNSMGEPEEPVVWDDLIEKYIKPGRVDLVLHVGDQVYAIIGFFDDTLGEILD